MIFMSEKKAQELYQQYYQAEIRGDEQVAESTEKELNKAGWYIVSGPDGMTVRRKENNVPDVDDYLIPKENNYTPYSGNAPQSNKTLWIVIGVVAGIAAIVAVVIIIKRRQRVPVRQL